VVIFLNQLPWVTDHSQEVREAWIYVNLVWWTVEISLEWAEIRAEIRN
jgi:hypothetical protein